MTQVSLCDNPPMAEAAADTIPSAVAAAEEALLAPAGLRIGALQKRLNAHLSGLDWADIFVQGVVSEDWRLDEGGIKTGHFSQSGGFGLRAVRGETTAFASSDIISERALDAFADAARIAKTRGETLRVGKIETPAAAPPRFAAEDIVRAVPEAAKTGILRRIDELARKADARVENVIATIGADYEAMLITRADGATAGDIRPMTQLRVTVVLNENGRRETGNGAAGGRCGFELFDEATIAATVEKALAEAQGKLEAVEAPAGIMPVVLGNGWAGIILHEAVGHGLEGDFNRKKVSAFSGRVGEQVAARGVTVVDAGDIPGRRGSLSCDDEGTPAQATTLIEDGVLTGYMQDIVNAKLMRAKPTGNGRRESHSCPPMPRMTNTFMQAGKYAAEEIIASVADGLYAADFGGGQVDITNGNFVFSCSKARRIKNGKLAETVKGATIIGNGPAIMPKVSMVGADFALDPGSGMCGKNGQWVPVGVGQPTIKVEELTVGGAAEK